MQKKNTLGTIAGILGLVALVLTLINIIISIVTVITNGGYYFYGVGNLLRTILSQVVNVGILAGAACALIGIGAFAENRLISGVAGGLLALFSIVRAIAMAHNTSMYFSYMTIATHFHGLIALYIFMAIAGVLICVGCFLKANTVSSILSMVAGGLVFIGMIVFVISSIRGYMFGFGSIIGILLYLAYTGTFVLTGLSMMKPTAATAAAAPAAAAPAAAIHPDPNWQAVPAPDQPAPAADFDPATELKRYQDLLMSGAISSEEYEQHRSRIMGK